MPLEDHLPEAKRIKERLEGCKTVADVALVANEERAAVVALSNIPEAKVLAIQIANLKAYMLQYM